VLHLRIIIIIFLIFFNFSSFFAAEKIDAIFVSKITTINSFGKVLLKWQNPSYFEDYITIYRYSEVIDSVDKLVKATKVIILKNKEEKFVDLPPVGNNYYAIMITNKINGKDDLALVPFRNYILKPVVVTKDDIFELNKFSAKSNKISIILEWTYKTESKKSTKVSIYRNTEQIKNEAGLTNSIKIATVDIESKLFIDVPIAGINYYYAIFTENDAYKSFIENISFSKIPVNIEKKVETINDFSTDTFIPLPLIALQHDPKSGKEFVDPQILKNPQKIEYNPKLNIVVQKLKKNYTKIYDKYIMDTQIKVRHLDFRLLTDEEIYDPKEYSQEYSKIINYIKGNDYINAQSILENLIVETISDKLLKRLSYYLGLIYYLNGDYYKSYQYLVIPYDEYKKEIIPFLDSIYYNVFRNLER